MAQENSELPCTHRHRSEGTLWAPVSTLPTWRCGNFVPWERRCRHIRPSKTPVKIRPIDVHQASY